MYESYAYLNTSVFILKGGGGGMVTCLVFHVFQQCFNLWDPNMAQLLCSPWHNICLRKYLLLFGKVFNIEKLGWNKK